MRYPHNAFFPSQSLYADQDRKRQRRLTAGAFASVVFGGYAGVHPPPQPTNNSTSNLRKPIAIIPPRGIEKVRRLTKNDVLAGRGGRINNHVGNIQFRDIVLKRKEDYRKHSTRKLEKAHIAAEIVYFIRSMDPPGRFLKEDADGTWYDIGDEKAIKKVGQALREDALLAKQKAVDDGILDNKEQSLKECLKGEINKIPQVTESDEALVKAESPTHEQPLRIVTVSSRGAKRVVNSTRSIEAAEAASSIPFQPLTYAEKSGSDFSFVLPAPMNKEAMKSSIKSSSSLRSAIRGIFKGKESRVLQANGVSVAAAAAMNDVAEEAFGRPFHPAENALHPSEMHQAEPSMISGMSSLSDWSHPSTSLTAPPLSFSSPRRLKQEQHCSSQSSIEPCKPQHQWNDKNFICFSPRTPNHECLEREASHTLSAPGSPDVIRETLLMSYFPDGTLDTRGRDMTKSQGKRSRSYGSGCSTWRASDLPHENCLPTENDSVNSLPTSLPGSILSDLSESLMALDLGDTKSKDFFEINPYH